MTNERYDVLVDKPTLTNTHLCTKCSMGTAYFFLCLDEFQSALAVANFAVKQQKYKWVIIRDNEKGQEVWKYPEYK